MAAKIDPSAEQLLLQMQCDKLYGEVVVKFESGRVVLLKKTETIKPVDDRNNRSEGDER
jgi:hypothetical protein